MFVSDEPIWDREMKKKARMKALLEQLDRAEAIARGLGIGPPEIARLREEGLRELSREVHSS